MYVVINVSVSYFYFSTKGTIGSGCNSCILLFANHTAMFPSRRYDNMNHKVTLIIVLLLSQLQLQCSQVNVVLMEVR